MKGVRIGMDGQTHPTTRVVVDLDQACAYELTPGPAGKLVLTLHANAVAKAAASDEPRCATATAAPSRAVSACDGLKQIRCEGLDFAQRLRVCRAFLQAKSQRPRDA